MPTTLQSSPPEPDDNSSPSPPEPDPYWRRQLWLPAPYRDSGGLLADLTRRLLSHTLHLGWRLHVEVRLRTEVRVDSRPAAHLAVRATLHHPDTIIVLSRTDTDAVPPCSALGTAVHVQLYAPTTVTDPDRSDAWLCVARLLTIYTVGAPDAAWSDPYYTVDMFPAASSTLCYAEVDGARILRRLPTRHRPSRHATNGHAAPT